MNKLVKRTINIIVFSAMALVVLMCNNDPEEDNYVIQEYEQVSKNSSNEISD